MERAKNAAAQPHARTTSRTMSMLGENPPSTRRGAAWRVLGQRTQYNVEKLFN